MATHSAASARMTAFGEVELVFPYREALVDDLKQEIPARFRRWDPDDKVWRVMGAYAPAAIDLLLEHFPRAEVPGAAPWRIRERIRSSPARTEPPSPLPLPPIAVAPSPAPEEPERDRLVASVRCPKCHQRHDQPIRVVVQTSATNLAMKSWNGVGKISGRSQR
jgi:hypothetical protein